MRYGSLLGTVGRLLVVVTVLWFVPSMPGHAQLPYAPLEGEIAMMPPYCQVKFDTAGQRRNEHDRFARQFGSVWIHFHHYCHGLKYVNRARTTTNENHRRQYLGNAAGEFRYVLDRAPKTFWMLPQILVERGEVLIQLNRGSEGVGLLFEAITLNPRYLQGYLALIRYQKRVGDNSGVLQTATEGLRYLPSSDLLKRHYLESGGSEPFPKPVAVQPKAERSVSEPRAERASREAAQADRPASAVPDRSAKTPAESTEPGERSGSSCRFCPPEDVEQRWRDTFQ